MGFYLKNTFDMLGIKLYTNSCGKYKSFSDTFTNEKRSKEDKEQSLDILNSIYDTILEGITKGRKISRNEIEKAISHKGPIDGNTLFFYALIFFLFCTPRIKCILFIQISKRSPISKVDW